MIIAVGDLGVDRLGEWIDADFSFGEAALQILLLEEGADLARVGFIFKIPEQDFVAIGEKDIRYIVELYRVSAALVGCFLEAFRGALGFDHCHDAAMTVAQNVIGAGAVR